MIHPQGNSHRITLHTTCKSAAAARAESNATPNGRAHLVERSGDRLSVAEALDGPCPMQ